MHNLGENVEFGNNPTSQSQAILHSTLTSDTHFVQPQTMKCWKLKRKIPVFDFCDLCLT